MKLAVIGSRTFNDYDLLVKTLKRFHIDEIVSGGAIGTDSLAEKYSRESLLKKPKIFLPLFKRNKNIAYSPKWFFERNKEIVDYSDMIIAFWDGKSKGTKHALDYAKKQEKPFLIVDFTKNNLDIGDIFC